MAYNYQVSAENNISFTENVGPFTEQAILCFQVNLHCLVRSVTK